jgi:hypothetical protein
LPATSPVIFIVTKLTFVSLTNFVLDELTQGAVNTQLAILTLGVAGTKFAGAGNSMFQLELSVLTISDKF